MAFHWEGHLHRSLYPNKYLEGREGTYKICPIVFGIHR
jgi:hypothetical protein